MRRSGRASVPVLVAALALAGCGDGGATSPTGDDSSGGADPPTVIVTTSIWADIVSNLACDGIAEVETLVPSGADAHAFEPSLADRERLEAAALVVANGLGLEGGLEETLEVVEEAGKAVYRIAEQVSAENASGTGDSEGGDPHIWFDPVRVAGALPALGAALAGDAGLDPRAVDACRAAYEAELTALDAEIVEILAAVPEDRRELVTNHESLGAFAERYGFDVVGTIIPAPSTLAESSPSRLEALADAIEAAGTPAIFVEHEHSPTEAEMLADRVGDVSVVALHTEGLGEPGSGADTYIGFLRTNAQAIADALS